MAQRPETFTFTRDLKCMNAGGLGRERESVRVLARADKGESVGVEVWIERGGWKGMT